MARKREFNRRFEHFLDRSEKLPYNGARSDKKWQCMKLEITFTI